MRRILIPIVLLLCACQAPSPSTPGASASPSGSPSATVPPYWPPGVPPPPPPRAAPSFGPSEKDATNLQMEFVRPHIVLTATGVPEGVFSVIYTVLSDRDPQDRLQIDSVDPMASFKAKLEYDHLVRGTYKIRCYAKGIDEPLDIRSIKVP